MGASDLSPNRFESLFLCVCRWFLARKEGGERAREPGFPAAADASRLRAKTRAPTDAQTGLRRPGTGLGSPGSAPRAPARLPAPVRGSSPERQRQGLPDARGRTRGSPPPTPGAEVTSRRGDATGPGARGRGVRPGPAPRRGPASGARGPGAEEPSGERAQQRGPEAAAMASHVRRLKLYPEPQTRGAEGLRSCGGGQGLGLRPAPRPPPGQSPARGRGPHGIPPRASSP